MATPWGTGNVSVSAVVIIAICVDWFLLFNTYIAGNLEIFNNIHKAPLKQVPSDQQGIMHRTFADQTSTQWISLL